MKTLKVILKSGTEFTVRCRDYKFGGDNMLYCIGAKENDILYLKYEDVDAILLVNPE